MTTTRPFRTPHRAAALLTAVGTVALLAGCRTAQPAANEVAQYANPIFDRTENTSAAFVDGRYYFIQNQDGNLLLSVTEDMTAVTEAERHVVCEVNRRYGLDHLWRPQIVRIDGAWYIYFAADDGNTDNHQLYVLRNRAADPCEGSFELCGRIPTDPAENWAIHAHVFPYQGAWYMLWSGWESRRVYAETQCLYIARMADPQTLAVPRVKLSEPTLEWERQWINPDGSKAAYPIFVNEAPCFLDVPRSDKLFILYSASANWTPYYAVGVLEAERGCDLLDAASWRKWERPLLRASDSTGVYGPGHQDVIPSPDGNEEYLLYTALRRREETGGYDRRRVWMQRIAWDAQGRPRMEAPAAEGAGLPLPSGTHADGRPQQIH